MLLGRNIAVAINHHINRVGIGLIHSREIGAFGEHNAALPRVLFQILLDCLLGLGDVNGKHDEALVREFPIDLFDQFFFLVTVCAPGRPELKQVRPSPSLIHY